MSQFYIDTNESGLAGIDTITGNSGGAVPPDSSNNIDILGSGGVTVSGNASTHTLTITVSGAGFSWNDEATSFNALSENGYFIAAAATATLPATPSQGNTIIFNVDTSGSFVIQANTGQKIVLGNTASSLAGTCTNTLNGDSITLVYRSADATWRSISSIGMFGLA